ncbi:MAG: hypothetical protein WAO02_00575 [Verrucomicrobiia bacterium]
MKILFSTWQKLAPFTLGLFLAISATASPLQLVTTMDPSVGPPASGGGNSVNPIISPDGRYVLFASTADNLALTSSNTPYLVQGYPKMNVFLRDRTNGTTTLVSVNLAGTGGGDGDSIPVALSTNGQFALFESSASNLAPGDTNNATDVFVRDLVNGTNILVSISLNGGCANGVSGESAMTPDGRYVTFASTATNLVANDTNGIQDVFVRDLQNGTTLRASSDGLAAMVPTPAGYTTTAYSSDSPEITPDGRYEAFITTFNYNNSVSMPLLAGVFVHDLVAGTTTLVTSNLYVTNTVGSVAGHNFSVNLAISDNGQYLAFESMTNASGGKAVIQRYNLQTGFIDQVGTNVIANTLVSASPLIRNLDMTPDGRFIAFVVNSNFNSFPNDIPQNSFVYLWDAQSGTTTLVSCDTNNAAPTNTLSDWPAIDSSGRYVAFLSSATTLTTNVVTGDFHLYLRDLLAGSTILLDADTNGVGFPKDFMNPPRLTPDGRFVAFECTEEFPATNIYNQAYNAANRSLVPNDNNHAYDVFLRDLTTNTIELVSGCQPALPSQTPAGSGAASIFSVDAAGRFIAFGSAADSLVPNITNKYRAVLVHDLLGGSNLVVSTDLTGLANANGMSSDPSLSGDGRYVVFTSSATNLTAGDTNNAQDVFLRDLQAGTTTQISLDASLTTYNDSYSASISANGRYVLFHSTAKIATITGPSSSGADNLFLSDLQASAIYALTAYSSGSAIIPNSMTPDGHFIAFYGPTPVNSTPYLYVWDSQAGMTIYTNTTTGTIVSLAISPDGNRIVYSISTALNAVDRSAKTNWTIGLPYAASRAGLQFSGDARFLAYSTPSAQVALDTNGIADVYVYDFVTQSNFLVSQSNLSGAANGPSDSPAISSDGRFVAYRSFVTSLILGVTNSTPNVFLYDRQTGANTLLSANVSGTVGNNRSFAPQFSGDGQTVVFESGASDLVAQDYNQAADMVAIKIATSNPTPVFVGQMIFAPASRQSPTLTWPAVSGATYQVQFKNNLTDAVWQPLNGNTWVAGSQGYATDLTPNFGQRFYRVTAF